MSIICHPCALLNGMNGMSMNHLFIEGFINLFLVIEIARTVLAQKKKKDFSIEF